MALKHSKKFTSNLSLRDALAMFSRLAHSTQASSHETGATKALLRPVIVAGFFCFCLLAFQFCGGLEYILCVSDSEDLISLLVLGTCLMCALFISGILCFIVTVCPVSRFVNVLHALVLSPRSDDEFFLQELHGLERSGLLKFKRPMIIGTCVIGISVGGCGIFEFFNSEQCILTCLLCVCLLACFWLGYVSRSYVNYLRHEGIDFFDIKRLLGLENRCLFTAVIILQVSWVICGSLISCYFALLAKYFPSDLASVAMRVGHQALNLSVFATLLPVIIIYFSKCIIPVLIFNWRMTVLAMLVSFGLVTLDLLDFLKTFEYGLPLLPAFILTFYETSKNRHLTPKEFTRLGMTGIILVIVLSWILAQLIEYTVRSASMTRVMVVSLSFTVGLVVDSMPLRNREEATKRRRKTYIQT